MHQKNREVRRYYYAMLMREIQTKQVSLYGRGRGRVCSVYFKPD